MTTAAVTLLTPRSVNPPGSFFLPWINWGFESLWLCGSGLDLSNEPHSPECQIGLAQTVPSAELARLTPQVDMALGVKTREVGRQLVEKALADGTDERWQEFLQIVQASELSSLANTLDNDLVTFIRQLLD